MSEAEPLVSVIIPTYGRPALLQEAIQSVLRQTVDDLECLVVDDGSPEPPDVPDDPRVRLVVRERNGGLSAARNTGIEQARGRYLTFLDDDDMYTPERLAIGLEGVSRAPITLCWSRNMGTVRRGASLGGLRHWRNRILDRDVHDTIVDKGRAHMGQVTIERRVAPKLDERFKCSEGFDWWIRATRELEVATVPKVGYLRRLHRGPRITGNQTNRLDCRLFLLEVHADYFREHPRAEARQWADIGLIAERLGDAEFARDAFLRSLRMDRRTRLPWKLYHLARTMRPARTRLERPAAP